MHIDNFGVKNPSIFPRGYVVQVARIDAELSVVALLHRQVFIKSLILEDPVLSVAHLLRALETFRSLGIEFVSLSEQLDTSTPTGKMVFTVLGAVAELERSLIVERVRAGLRNAKARGRCLGRPKKSVNASEIATLRGAGVSWRKIARRMGVSARTARRAGQNPPLKEASVSAALSVVG
jgi:DNA invertase Pin-like site-specific DNA recombinase